jgi:Zn-finger nucleic acid-binding protein
MNCPSCGAPMRLEADKDCLVCDYCGNIHVAETNDDGVRVLDDTNPSEGNKDCPLCALPLADAAIDGQRILYCRRCHGMLIRMDIFAPLVDDLRSRRAGTAEFVRPFDSEQLAKRIQCPLCRQQMDTHPYAGGGNVVINDCERCEVNWLDHGELDRIVRAPDWQFRPSAPMI